MTFNYMFQIIIHSCSPYYGHVRREMLQILRFVIYQPENGYFHVNTRPCHHGMARPRVVDGGDGFQIWRVAVNMSNKQSRTAVVPQLGGWARGYQFTTKKK